MIENYKRAKAYLYRINPDLHKDILHDAYLAYHRRTDGMNLFEQKTYLILGVVKHTWWDYLRGTMFKKDGERYCYEFTDWNNHSFESLTPLDQLIAKDTELKIKSRVTSFDNPQRASIILQMSIDGYNRTEIAKELGLSRQSVINTIQNFKKDRSGRNKKVMQLKNPFVANPLPVVKKITRKQYDNAPEKYEEYEFNFDRDSDHNESYTLLTHKERYEGLLIIEKEKLYDTE